MKKKTRKFFPDLNLEKILPEEFYSGFNLSLPEPLNNPSTIFTLYGRNAIYLVAKGIKKVSNKKTVIVPSYSCGDEIAPFIYADFKARPYKINPDDLQLDFDDLEKNVDKDTAAILITHYFGFPQKEIEKVRKICSQNHVFLIEDCAHSFGGRYKGKALGSFGDFSIFSIRKFLPVPHGGALVINNGLQVPTPAEPGSDLLNFELFLFFGFRTGTFEAGTSIKEIMKKLGIVNYDLHGPREPNLGGYSLGITKFDKFLIKLVYSKDLLARKRDNFKYYLDLFTSNPKKDFELLFREISDDIVPLYFPLIVRNPEKVYSSLKKKGLLIAQPFWSDLHGYINWGNFPEIKRLKNKMLVLSLDKLVDRKDLDVLLDLLSYS